MESHLDKGIAYQLRALREREGWTQQELAEKVGMTQNAISRLESSNYGKATITTLKRLAKIYDVGLMVRLVPFSYLVDWVSGTPTTDYGIGSAFNIPSFRDDQGLSPRTNQVNDFVAAPPLPPSAGNVVFAVPHQGTRNLEQRPHEAPLSVSAFANLFTQAGGQHGTFGSITR